ncbi:ankyrin repeat with over 9 transmembrane domains at C-terminus [Cryptosporidium sp. chipmunk genotype I]|uniref:ankyrin repeat with over 9 transmembrane domains at C-terminus n=1 Tax=Cryptosporidium sp. chipmunk genotype I TaxID=1280935 RepID=UPI00351AADBA|nr:ankyrin repeat with over 9 transmembrane domains at C-terminus [Cryptosporidium sp. chipmunk genotype I]
MSFVILWGILLFIVTAEGFQSSLVNTSRIEFLEAEYALDRLGLWKKFADGNHSDCMEFTLRIDRMLNAVANADIGAMEQFIEMDEYSLKYQDLCGIEEKHTISSLYENAPGWGGETPLTILARSSLPRSSIMMQVLSSKGLDFVKAQMNGFTPLILAIIHKNFSGVKVLLNLAERQKYALHLKKTEMMRNSLHDKDSQTNSSEIRKVEIINEVDSMGRTALFHAVLMEDDRMVESLLMAGAEPNIADFSGITPLLLASKNNLVVIVKLLLSRGADQTILDPRNRDPLSVAIKNNHPDVILALLEDQTFQSKYLNVYQPSRYKGQMLRPTYHIRRLLDIFTVLQLKEEAIQSLFRIEFIRNDTSLCDLRDNEGRTIVNIATFREMYDLLEEVLEFYKNASIYRYEGYTSCNPHIIDKSGRGPVDYLLTGTASSHGSFYSLDNTFKNARKINKYFGTYENIYKNNTNEQSPTGGNLFIEFHNMGTSSLNVLSDRRKFLLTKFLKLSNPLDLSSYLFELLRKGGNPTVHTIKAMVNWLGGSNDLLLHRTSRDGHNPLTFALSTGQLTVAREILDILLDSPISNQNSYKSAVKLAIGYSASVHSSSVIAEVALRKPVIIHEWICERKFNSVIEIEELKFVLLNLPREFIGFSKHPDLCKPLYTIVKQILDPESQIESTEIVAIMLNTNGGLPFLEHSDVTMALKTVGTSLSISASFGLNIVPCLEWTSTMSYSFAPYFLGIFNQVDTIMDKFNQTNQTQTIRDSQIVPRIVGQNLSKTEYIRNSSSKGCINPYKDSGVQQGQISSNLGGKETFKSPEFMKDNQYSSAGKIISSKIKNLKNPGKIIIKYGLGSTISSILTGHGIIGTKRNQILDLVFSCPLRRVDPTLKKFQRSVLAITMLILLIWILITSFVIIFSSRSRLDIFGFIPKHSTSEADRLAFTMIEWKMYKLASVLRFISFLYCIIIFISVGRVRHLLFTLFFLLLGIFLKLNQFLLLKENDIADITTAFIREEMSDKDNTALNKDLEDNDDVNDQSLGMGNPMPTGGNEETRQEGIHLGTIGEEISASHSSATFTDSRNTFQSDIVKREQISAEQYALATLFIGICSFVIAISSNLQRFLFSNFREFYRFHESYYFVVNHTYIAISTEIILIINTWSLTFAILKAPGLMIFILMQRIQVLRYFLLAYPDINQNIFNSLKRNQIGFINSESSPKFSPNMNLHLPVSKGAVFVPPGRFDVVLCQWVRVRHAIMKRMHRRFTVTCKPYNTLYFGIGFVVLVFLLNRNNIGNSFYLGIMHYLLFDEFGFTLLTVFASYSITLIVIVWLACTSNQISEFQHWRLFWDAFSFMPPCSAQQVVLQHIKLTQDLDDEDKRVDLWSIPITNLVRNLLLLCIVVVWVYISIIGISYILI